MVGWLGSVPDNPPDPEYIKDVRIAWAGLIKKVYEVDPLICPHCGGKMRFLAVIEEAPVITAVPLTSSVAGNNFLKCCNKTGV